MTKPGDVDDEQLDDDDAERLLAAAEDDDGDDADGDGDDAKSHRTTSEREKGDEAALRDPGKRALDAMKRERNAARKELASYRAKIKEYEDKGKTETQRLAEAKEEAAARAAKAEERHRALTVAMDRAPSHATLAQVRAVAKRVRGESEDDLESDADELFELLAPPPPPPAEKSDPKSDRKVAGRPRERLRGGGDPDEEPEESDPRKLADMIRRSRF